MLSIVKAPLRPARSWVIVIGAFLLAEIADIAIFGNSAPGPGLSNLVQLVLGSLCVPAFVQAARRSENLGRLFWRLMTVTFLFWLAGQSLGTFCELTARPDWLPVSEILFVFSTCPLGMVLFLDPDNEPSGLDRVHVLDFIQAILFWSATYLYFQGAKSGAGLPFANWQRGLFLDVIIAGAFLMRVILTSSRAARVLFGRMLVFLALSSVADTYANYPGRSLWAGGSFDIVWTILIAIPLYIGVSWREISSPPAAETSWRTRSIVAQQFFPILYPSLVLLLSPGVAARHHSLAVVIVMASFACFSGRLLVIQHRLQHSEAELRRANSQLLQLSSVDGLTGIANRRMFDERLDVEWRRAGRERHALALIMADIDHFKALNDSLGHQQGDTCLIRIAAELNTRMRRAGDLVARFGGEEFVILLPGMSASHAAVLAEDLREAIEGMGFANPGSLSGVVTASFGVAGVDSAPFDDCQALLRAADQALYAAKRAGRNTVELSVGEKAGSVAQVTSGILL